MLQIKCHNCANVFNQTTHKPQTIFDCAHSVCLDCMKKISKCPECNSDISKVSTTNWTILELIRSEYLDFSCKLCFEQFDTLKHIPHVLFNCSHTYCIECINSPLFPKVEDNSNKKKCPICSVPIKKTQTNWKLLEICIGTYYEAKKSLQSSIDDSNEALLSQLNAIKCKKSAKSSEVVKDLRTQISSRTDELVKVVNTNKKKLIDQVKKIENKIKDTLNGINVTKPADLTLEEYKNSKDSFDKGQLIVSKKELSYGEYSIIKNSLNKKDLIDYIKYYQKKKKSLESKKRLINLQFDIDYVFVPNEQSLNMNAKFIGVISQHKEQESSSIVSTESACNEIIIDHSVNTSKETLNVEAISKNVEVLRNMFQRLLVDTEEMVTEIKKSQEESIKKNKTRMDLLKKEIQEYTEKLVAKIYCMQKELLAYTKVIESEYLNSLNEKFYVEENKIKKEIVHLKAVVKNIDLDEIENYETKLIELKAKLSTKIKQFENSSIQNYNLDYHFTSNNSSLELGTTFIGKIDKKQMLVTFNEEKKTKKYRDYSEYKSDYLYESSIRRNKNYYNELDDFMRAGILALRENKHVEANELFGKSISINPNDPNCWFKKGSCLSELKQKYEAIACFKKAIELDSFCVPAYVMVGNCLNCSNKHKECVEFMNEAIKNIPRVSEFYSEKATALKFLNKTDESINCIDEALSFEDSPQIMLKLLLNKAEALYVLRKKEDLVACLDQAIRECPDDDISEKVQKIKEEYLTRLSQKIIMINDMD